MSLPRTGLRKVVVDEVVYEWTIRPRKTSGSQYHLKRLTAAIQLQTDLKRGLLVVDFGVTPPGNWRNPHETSVTPQIIRQAVRKAIEQGWNPAATGTFQLECPLIYIPGPDSH